MLGSAAMLPLEGTLLEKLQKIEALHAGTKIDGERASSMGAESKVRKCSIQADSKSFLGPCRGNQTPTRQGRDREVGSDGSLRCSAELSTSEASMRRETAGTSRRSVASPSICSCGSRRGDRFA
jgi:hypothetical protein